MLLHLYYKILMPNQLNRHQMDKTDNKKKQKMKIQETTNVFIEDDYTSSIQSNSIYTPSSSSAKLSESDSQYIQYQNYPNKSQNSKINSGKCPTRSVHHNSQKHAVTTFKHMIDFPYTGQQSSVHSLARKTWKIFLHCKGGKNKELLSIVFGCQQAQQKRIFKKFKQYGFGQILQYDEKSIKDSQNLLRELVIQQMSPDRFQKHLKTRKMAQKEGFRLYMLNLIQELNNGPIQRRLAKQKSQGIVNLVQVDKMLTLSDEA